MLDWWPSSSGFELLGEKEFPGLGPVAAVQQSLALKLSSAAIGMTKVSACRRWSKEFTEGGRQCWRLVLKCYELRTRQHKMLKVKAIHPSKHYFP